MLLREEFRRYADASDVEAYVELLRRESVGYEDPVPRGEPLRKDPDDEYLVALARVARVDALVSGDPHLLALRNALPVLAPREFLDSLAEP